MSADLLPNLSNSLRKSDIYCNKQSKHLMNLKIFCNGSKPCEPQNITDSSLCSLVCGISFKR